MILLVAIAVLLGLLFWLCQRLPHITYRVRTGFMVDSGEVYVDRDHDAGTPDDDQDSASAAGGRDG